MSEIIEGSVGTESVGTQPVGVGVLRTTYGPDGIRKSGIGAGISMNGSGIGAKLDMLKSGIGSVVNMGRNSEFILTSAGEPITTSDGDRIVWD